MGIPPHVKCCGCCCSLHIGTAIGTGLYILLLLIFTVILPATFEPEGVDEAKAFCAGTKDAYRQGNDVNSALPFCTRRSTHPAPSTRIRLPAWRAGYNLCHGSDICTNDWDEVESAAAAADLFGWAFGLVLLVLLIVTMVLVLKKHAAGLKVVWKLLAVVQVLLFLQPIINAAVSNEAGFKQRVGNQVAGLFLWQTRAPMLLPPSPGPSPTLLPSFTRWPSKMRSATVRRACRRGFRTSI